MGRLPRGPDAGWVHNPHIQTPTGLRLSFQRYLRSADGRLPRPLPPSLGALPIALGRDGALVVPLRAQDAFWIGLQAGGPPPAATCLTLVAASARWRAAPVRVDVPARGASRVGGYPGIAGAEVFSFALEFDPPVGTTGCSRLECGVEATGERGHAAQACGFVLRLVDPAAFTQESGQPVPPPIDPASGYRGWLLP